MAVVEINSGTFLRCSGEDGDSGGVGAGVLRTEQRCECLKSQCMDRTSPELLAAEEPGQASHWGCLTG